MAITKMSNSGIATGGSTKYDDMLAGNPPFFPSNFDSIASFTLATTTATVTFTSIPQTYRDLHLRAFVRESGAGTGVNSGLFLRFNGDSGANNYARFGINGNGSTVAATNATTDTRIVLGDGLVQGGSTAGTFGGYLIDICNYASTTIKKSVRNIGGAHNTTAQYTHTYSNVWNNTAAITSIEVLPETNSFAAGTILALYGITGA